MFDEKRIYKISEINKIAKDLLEASFSNIWLEGEISNFKFHTTGTMYFSLKDEEAQINAVMYKNIASRLRFLPEDGMNVLIRGKITIFAKRGQYQVSVYEIEPAGKGALQLAFEQLKEKLLTEGLFDEDRKRSIPLLPQKIGVITSPTGAAIRDILSVIGRRFANVEILINPVNVQGDEAPGEIVEAIEEMNKSFPEIDVLIIARGGGSLEDLWAFNEEKVARAIYNSRLPIISAVGHEIDFTISDFVADKRAATPSAAAELVVQNKQELVNAIKSYRSRLENNLRYVFQKYKDRFQIVRDSIIFKKPFELVNQLQQELDNLTDRIIQRVTGLVQTKRSTFNLFAEKLTVLNPLAILGRGYSVTYKLPENKILKDVKDISLRDTIKVKLHKGEIISTVEEKQEVK